MHVPVLPSIFRAIHIETIGGITVSYFSQGVNAVMAS